MSQLSRYIQSQLDAILKEVQSTPPKRYTSLQRIKAIIERAEIDRQEKTSIKKSIHKVESAMRAYSTPAKKKENGRKEYVTPAKKGLQAEFQSDKHQLKELLSRKMKKKGIKDSTVQELQERYIDLKKQRETLESYLQELVAKAQKLQRIKASQTSQVNQHETAQQQNVRLGIDMPKKARRKTLHELMKKYYEEV